MADVTDADRARQLLREWFSPADEAGTWKPRRGVSDAIAAALAEEREKARTPFLAVADEIHARGTAEVAAMDDEPDEYRKNQCASRAATYARAEHLIRRAAEETP